MFRGHIRGIPADYKDSDYEGKGKVSLLLKVSMLSLTKEQLASQECDGGNAKRLVPAEVRVRQASLRTDPSGDRLRKGESLVVEVRPLTTGSDSQAPIKIVDGHPWSPGVY